MKPKILTRHDRYVDALRSRNGFRGKLREHEADEKFAVHISREWTTHRWVVAIERNLDAVKKMNQS